MDYLPEHKPPKKRSAKDTIMVVFGAFCVLYLLNPTMGFVELLPDRLPIIGNIDEAGATAGLIFVLRYFGYDIAKWFNKK